MVELALQRVERILATRAAEGLEDGGEDARVLVAEHRVEEADARLVAQASEGGGDRGAHPPHGVRVHPREHEREVRAVGVSEGGQRGGADPGVPLRDEPHQPLAQRGVGGKDRERAQGLVAQHVARGGELRRRRRRPPRVADRAEGAKSEEGHGLVGVADEGEQQVDRGGVGERAEAPGGERARAGIVRSGGGDEDRPELRALEAHRDPRGRPPVEARAGAVQEGEAGGGDVLEAGEGEQGEALLGPGVVRVARVVAAHGHAADGLRERGDHELRDLGRGARVADPPEGLRGPSAHPGVGVRERHEEPVHRRALAGEAEGEGGHAAHLHLLVVQQLEEGGDERGVGHPARGEGRATPHAPVGVAKEPLQLARAGRARVLHCEKARQLLDARRGRRRRGGLLRRTHGRGGPRQDEGGERAAEAKPSHHPPIIASARPDHS